MSMTTDIVSAYMANNSLPPERVPELIRNVFDALGRTGTTAGEKAEPPQPAVPIKKSVFPDYIICLEDGKKLKMLKRHLDRAYGMTPDQYREKWGLPPHYPMTAPNYAAKRSALAQQSGLGRNITARTAPMEKSPVEKSPVEKSEEPKSKSRGRRRKNAQD
ncbi:MucR family transcriptional regulator [Novacetimonas pomaceti]|uniref:Transcriptional regulator n=1 Tax=Novacetimonas pomaceti TaxID=2021998 RepID=A0A318QBZ3_9PROT|nr:MucR family transcriptional regulator [Novacetimonas pomaceti]PYD75051.1 transcriptional regulator [Novacetimonas pomaceti]